jgi:hypothetical protein
VEARSKLRDEHLADARQFLPRRSSAVRHFPVSEKRKKKDVRRGISISGTNQSIVSNLIIWFHALDTTSRPCIHLCKHRIKVREK